MDTSKWYFGEDDYGTDFYDQWTLFKVENSEHIKWINEESYEICAKYNIHHYVFLTFDEIIDVLAVDEPNIEVIRTA